MFFESLKNPCGAHHTGILVLGHALFKKVGLPLHGNEFHPVKRVLRIPDFAVTRPSHQPVCNKKVDPGMSPRFFSQKMEQKEPEKKIP